VELVKIEEGDVLSRDAHSTSDRRALSIVAAGQLAPKAFT
jgi:hypothetical protein